MRSFVIVGLVACVGCAVGSEREESLFPEDVPASQTKSAPVPSGAEGSEEGDSPYAKWHHWSTIDIPPAAATDGFDGLLITPAGGDGHDAVGPLKVE